MLFMILAVKCVVFCSTILSWLFKRNFQRQLSFALLMSGERRIAFSAITEAGVCLFMFTVKITCTQVCTGCLKKIMQLCCGPKMVSVFRNQHVKIISLLYCWQVALLTNFTGTRLHHVS